MQVSYKINTFSPCISWHLPVCGSLWLCMQFLQNTGSSSTMANLQQRLLTTSRACRSLTAPTSATQASCILRSKLLHSRAAEGWCPIQGATSLEVARANLLHWGEEALQAHLPLPPPTEEAHATSWMTCAPNPTTSSCCHHTQAAATGKRGGRSTYLVQVL